METKTVVLRRLHPILNLRHRPQSHLRRHNLHPQHQNLILCRWERLPSFLAAFLSPSLLS